MLRDHARQPGCLVEASLMRPRRYQGIICESGTSIGEHEPSKGKRGEHWPSKGERGEHGPSKGEHGPNKGEHEPSKSEHE